MTDSPLYGCFCSFVCFCFRVNNVGLLFVCFSRMYDVIEILFQFPAIRTLSRVLALLTVQS